MHLCQFFVFLVMCLFGQAPASDNIKGAPDMKGLWVNELGSEMVIERAYKNVFFGKYCTGVGSGPIESVAKLVGTIGNIRQNNSSNATTIGFTVTYITKGKDYPYSTATWSGIYNAKHGSKTKLYTTWILTRNIKNMDDLWGATRIGKDTFKKVNRKPRLCSSSSSVRYYVGIF